MGVFSFLFISFYFIFLSFSFYIFLSLFYSLFCTFLFKWFFVLVRVKQVKGFYKVFIIKIRGGGVYTVGNAITRNEINICRPAGFTALPGRSNIGHVVNYDRVRA